MARKSMGWTTPPIRRGDFPPEVLNDMGVSQSGKVAIWQEAAPKGDPRHWRVTVIGKDGKVSQGYGRTDFGPDSAWANLAPIN